ncbi:MAG: hypothetical protein B6D61_11750 [Bacteroidetes bacterium 4484_249]|nr:MAG: hypothetical protein B6D61_11750 [Bacteroidetes bacterium 4484_249]
MSHSAAQGKPPGFDMTRAIGMTGADETTVVIVNILGQTITRLPVKTEKTNPPSASLWRTLWDTRQIQNGIYFYKVEIEGKIVSGKVVIQK